MIQKLYISTENFRIKMVPISNEKFLKKKNFCGKILRAGAEVRELRIWRGIVAAHGVKAESDQRKKLRLSAKEWA